MKRLLILSGKGGTGKTTTTAAFIRFAQARAVADCDVDAPNLHLVTPRRSEPVVSDFFGGEKAAVDPEKCVGCGLCVERCRFQAIRLTDGVCQVNEYSCEGCGVCAYVCPQEAVTLVPDRAGQQELYLEDGVFSTAALKMGRGNSGKLVTKVKLDLLKYAPETDLAILDGSPGIGCPVIASVSGMDLVLVVAEPSQSGLSDLKRLAATAEALQARIAVCVNKWDVSPAHTQAIREFCTAEGIPFVGMIPYDRRASQAINAGKSLADVDCPARDALYHIFQAVCGLLGLQTGDPNAACGINNQNKKGVFIMKIAVAAMGKTVAGHFGHCENFIFFDAADGGITGMSSVPNPGHRPGFLPNFLADNGAEVVIAGGMGGGAVDIFEERGVKVILGVQGDAQEAVEAYLRGELVSSGSVCHEHEHADECGEHK